MTEKKQELEGRREQLIANFCQSARSRHAEQMQQHSERISITNDFLESLDRIAAELSSPASGPPKFAVSSLFLNQCFEELTADRKEQFFFITGAEVGNTFVLDQRITFEHERRTEMGVTADPRSTHRLLITLEKFRHKLLAHFHSHPGNGPDSTHPSGIDERFQKRLEDAGHVAIAAIFSRDGFIRFFRLDQSFEIEVYGEGVERHEQNIFRLTNIHSA